MKFYIEKDTFGEGPDPLKAAAVANGHSYKEVEYVFYDHNSVRKDIDDTEPWFFYGSLNAASTLKGLRGLYYDADLYKCTTYYPQKSKFLLNAPYIMLPFGELVSRQEFLFEVLGSGDSLFLRPDRGDKPFTGTVVNKETYAGQVAGLSFYDVQNDLLTIVATPKNIVAEWRFFMVDETPNAVSLYRRGGKLEEECYAPPNVWAYAEEVGRGWRPQDLWFADVCQLKNGELKLVEINSGSCSGLYSCDVHRFVRGVAKVIEREW